jgi:hypothetical protein
MTQSIKKNIINTIKWEIAMRGKEEQLKKKRQEEGSVGQLTETQKGRVVEDLCVATKGGETDVMIVIAILLQKGATSKKQLAKVTEEWNDVKISTGMLRNACSSHKVTVRKLARAISSDVIGIMKSMKEHAYPGNLAKRYLLENPDAKIEELIWVSDFQTFNPECPEKIKEWLTKDFNERFKKIT